VRGVLLFALTVLTGSGSLLAADDPASAPGPRASLGVTAGLFEFTDDNYRAAEIGVQCRGAGRWWLLHPMGGGMVNADGAFNLYAGFGVDVPLGQRLLIRLAFAPGYYNQGDGKDLGSGLEFRSSFELGWRFGDGWRIGVEAYHLSNAQLGDINPGNGSLVLGLTVPLGRPR
jgi:lipid A 3-O-deacylase